MPVAPSLGEILRADSDDVLVGRLEQTCPDMGENSEGEENVEEIAPEGFCIECKDQKAHVHCEQCQEDFCEVCSGMIHRTGRRKLHALKKIDSNDAGTAEHQASVSSEENSSELAQPAGSCSDSLDQQTEAMVEATSDGEESAAAQQRDASNITHQLKTGAMTVSFSAQTGKVETSSGPSFNEWIKERAKYIPLRLTLKERKYLRLLEAALNVSEYTDKIDILMYSNKTKRIVAQIKELCAILSGLLLASDYKAGQALFEDRQFEDNEDFYQKIFEIGRRHKIMNPEKMRNEYGKLIYMLQDSQTSEVKSMLGFSIVAPIKTVYSVLESLGVLYLLEDEMVAVATKEIHSLGKTQSQVRLEIKQKERAVEYLCKAYATPECPSEVIRQCLYSIGDNHAYLRFNRDPCDRMLGYLTTLFTAKHAESDNISLAILYGRNGSRLSHSHESQFHYVQQTLTLWREILHDMFMLWHHSDSDLLSLKNTYRLKDTGQGLNRVQVCPRVSKAAHTILHRTQKAVGRWVGSSMIHLGDRNVPNALMFIDKYNQVASILNPVVRALEFLEVLESSKAAGSKETIKYIESMYGTILGAKKHILADFFRSAFDGSGADNFFDAGSCIDGRLTSAWNWCSTIENKSYFNIFLLSGFVGFNGGPEGFN
ncbi:hypothetical protein GGI25_005305 [Coemansia spiralis]|uniref:B box-type domain-containing protein n=1 Tax=Coemansia spiralis TaxID=417178 RepID=A0A9W8G4W9_9FUNG|nr:hypothetical protein GGI25_005305 [Coemansia spiralis]